MKCPKCRKEGFNCYESRKGFDETLKKFFQEQRRVCKKDEGGCGHTEKTIYYPPQIDENPNFTTISGSNGLEKAPI